MDSFDGNEISVINAHNRDNELNWGHNGTGNDANYHILVESSVANIASGNRMRTIASGAHVQCRDGAMPLPVDLEGRERRS